MLVHPAVEHCRLDPFCGQPACEVVERVAVEGEQNDLLAGVGGPVLLQVADQHVVLAVHRFECRVVANASCNAHECSQ